VKPDGAITLPDLQDRLYNLRPEFIAQAEAFRAITLNPPFSSDAIPNDGYKIYVTTEGQSVTQQFPYPSLTSYWNLDISSPMIRGSY
jgi:hypothetical protein